MPLLFILTLPLSLFALAILLRAGGGKYDGIDPVPHTARPDATHQTRDTPVLVGPNIQATRPVRVEQTLPHTCGFRSMQAAYRAYSLDPEAYNIRYRLGTDFTAFPTAPGSEGTLHPDLLRVLAQDGFETTVLDLDQTGAAQQLADHLERDQLALTVVYRSTYHWMVLATDGPDQLWVIDSLAAQGSSHGIQDFVDDEALSIILIKRRHASAQTPSRTAQHLLGTSEMARTYERQRAREAE
ncbi:hypothetical protein OT109_09695 [Phycisphaeraceae bacterium D3-23]